MVYYSARYTDDNWRLAYSLGPGDAGQGALQDLVDGVQRGHRVKVRLGSPSISFVETFSTSGILHAVDMTFRN